jgi:hypothetical protein
MDAVRAGCLQPGPHVPKTRLEIGYYSQKLNMATFRTARNSSMLLHAKSRFVRQAYATSWFIFNFRIYMIPKRDHDS